ncbi:helix-turn-helix domain-containing protein [Chengkuizengella sediminis]|uniref:helix-turn-helix domain-containing protein n=1 Tax=Chengkuizengella sediminis TaxID=1885917 RepID=UPI001389FB72|nr:helix-turn-helix domain-containing protein [Chengkuizengella sediminis]NDI33874.1 helix-turn-helix domain-containing protein [Chengkuizengella sediminis]
MNMLQSMNECIDYIEKNMNQKIELSVLASKSLSSKFHFQRMFHMLTGYTVAEYIRKRRLTLAAQELTDTKTKVINVALKYGYETPESFSKAFRRVHGISPSQVRESDVSLVAFPRITFHISLKGEKEMNYKIMKKDSIKVIGKGIKVPMVKEKSREHILKFREEMRQESVDKHILSITGQMDLLGVIMDIDHEKEEFTYFIGAMICDKEDLENYEQKEISSASWAVFESIGAMPDAVSKVWDRVYSEWFPSTGYEQLAGVPEIELIPPGDDTNPNYRCEIWIPIKKK